MDGMTTAPSLNAARRISHSATSLPSITRTYIKDGVVQTVILWNTHDLGYLTVHAAALTARNALTRGTSTIMAGALGKIAVQGSQIILGPPLFINKANVDQFDF